MRVGDAGSFTNLPFERAGSVAKIALFSIGANIPIYGLMSTVTLTPSAAKRINAILAKQDDAEMLRVSVEGGGCSGFSYKFDFAQQANSDDTIVELDGARVAIDEMSMEFLAGSEIDFSTELIGSAFKINNPNATAGCGCGTSFSV